ncbi:MAG TPA: hypothetical protein VFD58_14475, partial [Blastocatellia bacterium]|nr:hypothetical protein [Blastocatellia bacterium]
YFHGEALEWPLLNLKGEAIESGLYAYTLSTRADTETTAHTQRGHLIIDRASSADRVWVTSSPELSLGTASEARKVTVVGGGELTVGGAELSRERPTRSQPDSRSRDRQVETAKAEEKKPQVAAATSGTANRIAKFDVDGSTLINSTVTESVTGDIGIGTAAPGGVLDLQRSSSSDILQRFWNTGSGAGAGAKLRYVAATGATSQMQLTDGLEWLMAIAGNNSIGMQFRVRDTGTPNTEAQLNASARMTILRNGNVGIGTTSPGTRLDVQGSVSTFNGVALALTNTNGGNTNPWVLGTGGAVVAKDAFSIGDSSSYKLVILSNGNVGIGITSPAAKLTSVGLDNNNSNGTGQTGMSGHGGNAPGSSGIGGVGVMGTGGNAPGSSGNGGIGVLGVAGDGFNLNGDGILGMQTGGNGHAGRFDGDVLITGNLFVDGNKNFKIDHPLDPENKYLLHAAIESSEVLNVYSGNVTTDEQGNAVVELPDWFEALNKDFRYQLTVINTFAQAIIAEKIKGNRFVIRTNVPGVEVSWQVTGVRSDARSLKHPFKVEEDKPASERGTYLSPEAFGQPEEKGLMWARQPELMRQVREQRERAQKEQAQPPNP